jgi:hypothetical protein
MSDDLVNQITLNFLISKQQLQKLNKKIKQKEEDKMKTDMEIYKDQFVDIFFKMINNELPSDLLEDVKHSYTYFVEKSIYYLKMKASNNDNFEKMEEEELSLEEAESSAEEAESSAEEDEEEDEEEDDLEEESSASSSANEIVAESSASKEISNTNKGPILITQFEPKNETRYKKFANTKSKGVDDIQHLPLDWFSKVRQTYKQNQIIPRHNNANTEISSKEVVLESPTNYKNTEKKNINRLYEDKTNDKNKKTK